MFKILKFKIHVLYNILFLANNSKKEDYTTHVFKTLIF
jgi:hypothetical protein